MPDTELGAAPPHVRNTQPLAASLLQLQETGGNQMVVRLLAAQREPAGGTVDGDAPTSWLESDADTPGPVPDTAPGPAAPAPTVAADGAGQGAITESKSVKSKVILHPEEIFRDVQANFGSKREAFQRLKKAYEANVPAEIAAATQAMKTFIVTYRINQERKQLRKRLRAAKKSKDSAEIAELEQAITSLDTRRRAELEAEVEAMRHTDPGHTDKSVFEPVQSGITHYDFAFADGENVRLHDRVVAYATTVSFGVETSNRGDRDVVKAVMASAGLSPSRFKILAAISGFEGGFDTVNTYDKAKVTWGFVQWTGGKNSDLTKALAIIKKGHPDAFAENFQAYGIDVVSDELVIAPPDGTPPIKGKAAADAIMRNPRLAAVLAHAGRDEDVQKGQVEAAAELEIDRALAMKVTIPNGKDQVTTTADRLITSEYGVGVLANTYVHSGGGKAREVAQGAMRRYVAQHGYSPDDQAWMAGAEEAIVPALAAKDSKRAVKLRKLLDDATGSFE